MTITVKDRRTHAGVRGSTPRTPRVLIVGLGNDLMMDDGVGIHLVRELNGRVPKNCKVIAVGTAVLDALHLFERADIIIAVDAMQAGSKPGTLYRLEPSPSDLLSGLTSLHEMTFLSTLTLARKKPREIVVFGVEPEHIEFGMELTETIQSVLPRIAEVVAQAARERVNQFAETA